MMSNVYRNATRDRVERTAQANRRRRCELDASLTRRLTEAHNERVEREMSRARGGETINLSDLFASKEEVQLRAMQSGQF